MTKHAILGNMILLLVGRNGCNDGRSAAFMTDKFNATLSLCSAQVDPTRISVVTLFVIILHTYTIYYNDISQHMLIKFNVFVILC